MDLILLYKALIRRKWLLIIVPILSAAASIYFTKDFKRMYKSTAQLSTGFTVSEQVSVTEEKFNMFQTDIKFNNVIETINSPKVFGLLSYRLLLHDLESDEPFTTPQKVNSVDITMDEVKSILNQRLEDLESLNLFNDKERKISDLLKIYKYDYKSLREAINVFRIQGTDYLQVVGFTERPKFSAEAVNILCSEFLRYYDSHGDVSSKALVKTFNSLVTKKEEELRAAEMKLKDFKAENGIINLDASSESQIGLITELETEKEEVTRNRMSQRLELAKVDRILSSAQAKNNNNNSNILKLRANGNRLSQKIQQGGPNQQMYQDSLEYIRNLIQNNLGDPTRDYKSQKEDLETGIEISNRHISSINRRLSRLRGQIGTSASVQANLSNLEREVNRASEEYLNAQEKYNTALDLANTSTSSITQTSYGQPPIDPEPSKRITVTALSGIASFVFCLLFIVFTEYIDVSLKSPSNFQKKFDLPLIGGLNKLKLKKKRVSSFFQDEGKIKNIQTFREQMRKVRYEVQSSGLKVFLITSNKIGEGKSTFIEALANGLSLSKNKVLLIDANFSNNTLTKLFEAKETLEILGGKEENKITLEDHISDTDIENVDIIGCEGGSFSPSEIFDFERFKKVVEGLSEYYDYILIESSAMNYFTDSKELIQFADRVIAVYSAESVIKQLDHESILFLKQLSAKFLGVVLNMVKTENINQ